MPSYVPCEGSGKNAVNLDRYAAIPSVGVLDHGTPASTFGKCPDCERVVRANGTVNRIKVTRHKAQIADA